VSKKADSIMRERDDPSDLTPPAPRAERFGEGVEARGAERERGHAGERKSGGIGQFLHDVRSEMRRVAWPTAKEVQNTTIITLVAMVFFAAYLYGVDEIWAFLINQLIRLLGGA
jgi:preprotein translocase subunit SecE